MAFEKIAKRLCPDNIQQPPPRITSQDRITSAVFNPVGSLPIHDSCVYIGNIIGLDQSWWKIGIEPPDGSYAIFRADENTVEVLSDIVGSRTVWYVKTENVFIASTSQRAIVCLLGSFEPDKTVYSWMLSSGTLGPGHSWDLRIRCLQSNAKLVLDRQTWNISIKSEPAQFCEEEISAKDREKNFHDAIASTFEKLDLDFERWILPLSGGYDSRAILMMLKAHPKLRTVTWGLKSGRENKHSDAYIAKKLAKHFNIQNDYFETDLIQNEPLNIIFDRFFMAGEGRVDHISGYMDGFRLWKILHEQGIEGVIRGDEGFGWVPVHSELETRKVVGLTLVSDYENFTFLGQQALPESLTRRSNETLDTYRDRLYHDFRLPYIMAALNDLKCSYVEISNPLLSRRIISEARKHPDSLRTDKKYFKQFVEKIGPPVNYATDRAIAHAADILRNRQVAEFLTAELLTVKKGTLFPDDLIDNILANIVIGDRRKQVKRALLKRVIKTFIPRSIIDRIRPSPNTMCMDYNKLAFRIYLISRMNEILMADSKTLEIPMEFFWNPNKR